MNNIYLLFGAVALIGIGGAGFFIMKKKKVGKPSAQFKTYEDDDAEDPDDEFDFYDKNDDE